MQSMVSSSTPEAPNASPAALSWSLSALAMSSLGRPAAAAASAGGQNGEQGEQGDDLLHLRLFRSGQPCHGLPSGSVRTLSGRDLPVKRRCDGCPRSSGARAEKMASWARMRTWRAVTDVLGEPYLAETIPLPPDDEGQVVATLVRRTARRPDRPRRCCTCTASPTTSSRPGTPTGGPSAATTSTRSTCASTAARCCPTRPRTTSPTCATTTPRSTRPGSGSPSATGTPTSSSRRTPPAASIVALWADDRRPASWPARCMNSPWLDLQGSALLRARRHPDRQAARRAPADARDQARTSPASTPAACTSTTRASGTSTCSGSRSSRSPCTPAGCAPSARATPELHRGLDARLPGAGARPRARSALPEEMGEDVHGTDIVLDVAQIRRWATALGRTSPTSPSRAPATTSSSPVRSRAPRAYDAIATWMTAWVDPPKRELL